MKRLIALAFSVALILLAPQRSVASVSFDGYSFSNSTAFSCSSSPCNVTANASTTGSNTSPVLAASISSVSGTCTVTLDNDEANNGQTSFSSSTGALVTMTTAGTSGVGYTFSGCTVSGTFYYN